MTTFGSLFSGIGGLDLGLERAGWECAWQVENDEWCRRVLAQHWPSVPRYGDIREVRELPPVELLCGGFPCQPVSTAGRRLAQDDPRWLWPEFAGIVRLLRPRYVLVENVPGLLARGMGDVLGDLAACGYDAEWDCIPAAAVGAPHLRYRVWIVAHRQGDAPRPDADGLGSHRAQADQDGQGGGVQPGHEQEREPRSVGGAPAHAEREQLRDEPGRLGGAGGSGASVARDDGSKGSLADPEVFAERPRLCTCGSGGERWRRPCDRCGTSDPWATEPDVGRVAHGVPARVDRLRGLGNAVVPQLAEWIGRRLMEVSA